jgi:hypothetical protein
LYHYQYAATITELSLLKRIGSKLEENGYIKCDPATQEAMYPGFRKKDKAKS